MALLSPEFVNRPSTLFRTAPDCPTDRATPQPTPTPSPSAADAPECTTAPRRRRRRRGRLHGPRWAPSAASPRPGYRRLSNPPHFAAGGGSTPFVPPRAALLGAGGEPRARPPSPRQSRSPRSGPQSGRLPATRPARSALPVRRASLPARAAHRLPADAEKIRKPIRHAPQNPATPPQFPPQTPLSRSRPASEQAGSPYALPAPGLAGSDPPPNNVHVGGDTAEGGRTASFSVLHAARRNGGFSGAVGFGLRRTKTAPRREPNSRAARCRRRLGHLRRRVRPVQPSPGRGGRFHRLHRPAPPV